MPLYEYRCNGCNRQFERIVKFSDPPLKSCPHCGADAIHQVIHAPAVQFKGSGWYVSDYARKGGKGAESKSESGGPEKVSTAGESSGAKEGAPAAAGSEKPGGSTAKDSSGG